MVGIGYLKEIKGKPLNLRWREEWDRGGFCSQTLLSLTR